MNFKDFMEIGKAKVVEVKSLNGLRSEDRRFNLE